MTHALTPEQRDRLERSTDLDVVAAMFALEEANDKVTKLTSKAIGCLYCGAIVVGSVDHFAEGMRQAWTDHMASCEKHPMRALEKQVATLREPAALCEKACEETRVFFGRMLVAEAMVAHMRAVLDDARTSITAMLPQDGDDDGVFDDDRETLEAIDEVLDDANTAAVAARYVDLDSPAFRAQLESLFDVAIVNADAIKAGHGGSACFVDGTLLALRGAR